MPLVILLFALFASLFTLTKICLDVADPFFIIGSRMTLAGLILTSHQWIYHREAFSRAFTHFKWIVLLGLLNIYLTNVTEIWGLQHMTSAKTCLLYSLSPFVAALVAYWALGERLNPKKWLGLCIGFIGLWPILLTSTSAEGLIGELSFVSWAELAVIVAVVSSVYGWILLKKVVNQANITPLLANGLSMLLGGGLALIHSVVAQESWNPLPIRDGGLALFIEVTLWMTLVSNIICYNLYGYLLKRFSATFMSLAGLVTPLFASMFGWFFLNEQITWHYFVAMGIFTVGLFIFYQEEILQHK